MVGNGLLDEKDLEADNQILDTSNNVWYDPCFLFRYFVRVVGN
mgnify:CR=1 FL=1